MDLIKKKLRITRKKEKRDKKSKGKSRGKTPNKSKKKHKNSRDKSSSESDSDSGKELRAAQSKNQLEAEQVERKFRMAGCLQYKPKDPPEFPKKLMGAEYREMFATGNQLSVDDCKLLDEFLRRKAELRSSDHIVLAEKVSDDDEKVTQSRLKILAKYDEGRFGAVYIVQNESAVDQNVVSVGNGHLMMKTAVRNIFSIQVTSRLNREIRILKAIATTKEDTQKRTPSLLFEGRVLGVPFFVIPFMDANLEKCREEMGGMVSIPSAFFIAQEVLLALKHIHKKGYVHRDVKPTNIVLNSANRRQWYLIDFGESVRNNSSMAMSPPDGITLPYISREAHDLLQATGGNYLSLDVESWFYVMLDLLRPLPWKENPSIENVLKAKKKFWDDLDTSSLPPADYPPQVAQIAKLVKGGKQEPPYTEISKHLEAAFMAVKETDWKPDWIDRQLTAQLNKEKRQKTPESRRESVRDKKAATPKAANNDMDERNRDLMRIPDNQMAQVVPESTREMPPEKPKERDRSMYVELREPKPEKAAPQAHTPHRIASQELAQPPPNARERSVYCDVGARPSAPSPGGRRYRYKK